ncbi:hypothetical protein V6N13_117306 [Hibiscus sabdariffa]|uniref:UBA domain-containing protein n=1 Tax=Hibiscus sabdariffa TaxID=183260 RepID=A0ABR2PA54_9ROSI
MTSNNLKHVLTTFGNVSEKTVNSDERRKSEGSGYNIHGSMDAVNEDCIGIHTHNYDGCREREMNRSIGEAELMGGSSEKGVGSFKDKQSDMVNGISVDVTAEKSRSSWAKGVEKDDEVGKVLDSNPCRAKMMEELTCMGFSRDELDQRKDVEVEMVQETYSEGNKFSWEKEVNRLNNPKHMGADLEAEHETVVDSEEFSCKVASGKLNFPELQKNNLTVWYKVSSIWNVPVCEEVVSDCICEFHCE